MRIKIICTILTLSFMFSFPANLSAEPDSSKAALQSRLDSTLVPTVVYPMDYAPQFTTEVVCSVKMSGDPYYGVSDWLIGDEIYKTYQEPTVEGINCEYPFEVDEVAMMLNVAAAGSVYVSVDIEDLDPNQSLPSCPYPGFVIGLSEEWGYYLPEPGLYLFVVPFEEPVPVTGPYFCGFYIANDISGMGPELVTDADPYMCVNWNNWGEGYIDLVENQYYNFPGNLVLYSIGRSGGGGPSGSTVRMELSWPPDSMTVSNSVPLRVSEMVDTLSYLFCKFQYYNPSGGWVDIYEDFDAGVSLRNSVGPSSYEEGYSAVWNVSGFSEGWYQLRAMIFTDQNDSIGDTISVYVDNTPLEPEFTNPQWGGSICDSVTLAADVADEDATYMQFEYRAAVDSVNLALPLLKQDRYGDTDNDTLDGNHYSAGEFGEFYNAPTTFATMIRYLANNGYPDLAGSLTDRNIVEELADSMNIRMNLGAEDDNLIWTIKEFVYRNSNNIEVDVITSLDAHMLDFICGYRKGTVAFALGQPYGHWIALAGIDFNQNPDGSYDIKIYDSKTGTITASQMTFNPLPQINYQGAIRTVDLCLGIYPRYDNTSRTVIGLDFNPSNGFSYYWIIDTLTEGAYYVAGVTIDNSQHSAEGMTRTIVSCLGDVVPSDNNGDGMVNISDAVWMINYVFTGGPPPLPYPMNGDSNCDGGINISDAVWLINYVFTGGPPPCN